MKIKELVEKLQEFDPEMEVVTQNFYSYDQDSGGEYEYTEPEFDYYLKPKTKPFEEDKYDYGILVIK